MEDWEVGEKPKIELLAWKNEEYVSIIVKDNGQGIDQDKLDKIFVPFYSTKEKGSGIGLSLSKQIMQLHNGKIAIDSEKDKGTEIQLLFPVH